MVYFKAFTTKRSPCFSGQSDRFKSMLKTALSSFAAKASFRAIGSEAGYEQTGHSACAENAYQWSHIRHLICLLIFDNSCPTMLQNSRLNAIHRYLIRFKSAQCAYHRGSGLPCEPRPLPLECSAWILLDRPSPLRPESRPLCQCGRSCR